MQTQAGRVTLLGALIVAHALALWGLAQFGRGRVRPPDAPATVTQVMLLRATPPDAPDAGLRVPPPRRAAAAPRSAAAAMRSGASRIAPAMEAEPARPAAAPLPASFYDAQGRLRVSRRLAEELDASAAARADAAARAGNSFHVPLGDQWLLRAPRAPLAYEPTVFDEAWMPDDMNPIEEACWRNRAVQLLLVTLGSIECMAPGKELPRPTPELIVYGEDDADDILRKSDDWQRYNHD